MGKSQSTQEYALWAARAARQYPDLSQLHAAFCRRLIKSGIRLAASRLEVPSTDPLISVIILDWQRGRRHAKESYRWRDTESPFPGLFEQSGQDQFQPADAVAVRLKFSDRSQGMSFWWLADPVDPDQADILRQAAQWYALPLEILLARHRQSALLRTYLGARTARHIQEGKIGRGMGETINAAIVMADVRGFTKLSQTRSPEQVLSILNAHFDCWAAPIKAYGGEILKYMGDGMLAIFPADNFGAGNACRRALRAIRAAQTGLVAVGRQMPEANHYGCAVHCGRIVYGNMGAVDRLDFTAIGEVVNMAARIEKKCKELQVPILISAEVARYGTNLVSLGLQRLPDIESPVELYSFSMDQNL